VASLHFSDFLLYSDYLLCVTHNALHVVHFGILSQLHLYLFYFSMLLQQLRLLLLELTLQKIVLFTH
jgi:hypothetical protein